jgi:hypothetical protein
VEVTYLNEWNETPSYTGEVIIPEIVTYSDTEYTVTSIGDEAFMYCGSLTSIELPSTVTTIGYCAFTCCNQLTSIKLSTSLALIGERAFEGCWSLKSIKLPSPITSIGYYSFSNCWSLKSIELPSSITSIGDGTFSGCHQLASIELPSSVTEINDNAFAYCESLTIVTSLNSEPPTLGDDVFWYCPIETVYVPNEAVESYQAADVWKEFNIVGIGDAGVEDIIFVGDTVENVTVYTLQGLRVKGVRTMDDVKSLTSGIYIVNGKKLLVK